VETSNQFNRAGRPERSPAHPSPLYYSSLSNPRKPPWQRCSSMPRRFTNPDGTYYEPLNCGEVGPVLLWWARRPKNVPSIKAFDLWVSSLAIDWTSRPWDDRPGEGGAFRRPHATPSPGVAAVSPSDGPGLRHLPQRGQRWIRRSSRS
jgi:hypothetical protein